MTTFAANANTTINRYETWELEELLSNVEPMNPWLSTTFFPREKFFNSTTIEYDELERLPRMAPFSGPLDPGVPTRNEGFITKSLSAAYIKLNDLVTPQNHAYVRRPGEAPYGGSGKTPMQRVDEAVAEKAALHRSMIQAREEWMAAQILLFGAMTISGDTIGKIVVDFQRPVNNYLDLTGQPTAWDQAGANPLQDIQTMSLQVRINSFGGVVTDLIMTGNTWNLIKDNAELLKLVNQFYRFGTTSADIGPQNDIYRPILVAKINDRFSVWSYDAFYTDDNGTRVPMIPDYYVIGIANSHMEGTKYYGAIQDLDAGLVAAKMFQKSRLKWNPSALEILTQSAPMLAPRRMSSVFVIKVK